MPRRSRQQPVEEAEAELQQPASVRPGSFERLTPRAREALVQAEEAARRLNQGEIRPEHLLIGLLQDRQGLGARVLASAGVNLDGLRASVEASASRGEQPVSGILTLSSECKRVLQVAVQTAERLAHQHVGTEHLLLGLVREGRVLESEVLAGLSFELLRRQAMIAMTVRPLGTTGPLRGRSIGPSRVAEAEPQGGPRDNVVSVRVSQEDLAAVDALVEVGIVKTRSEAAARLLHAGIAANRPLFERARDIQTEIRRLREEAQQLAAEHAAGQAEAEAG